MSALNHRPRPTARKFATQSKSGAPLGQHFLVDERIKRRIIDTIEPSPDAVVLEIGAGPANMTRLLAERANKLISVEIDEHFASKLQTIFSGNSRVEIVNDDFLNVSIPALAARNEHRKLFVFGNLPYYITTPILMKLFDSHDLIEKIVVMMQYEVAQRLKAAPGDPEYGLLGVTAQFFGLPKLLFKIPPSAFNPPPKVMSALVSMTIRSRAEELGITDERNFWKWTRAAFEQKRKTLANNWRSLAPAERIAKELGEAGLEGRVRAEDLSLTQLAEIYCLVSRSGI
jgi:16S rRNA (adenine1518-N6/adenine1519-N6)-dimethyltransferase